MRFTQPLFVMEEHFGPDQGLYWGTVEEGSPSPLPIVNSDIPNHSPNY
ncbi:MAG: hypothetical protein QNL68_09490 [Akkermansiaceae bacterium]|jgi:hypothetical protein